MRRLFWLAMGITIGVLVVRRLSRAAEKLTPQGIAASLADGLRELAGAIGDFGADVRAAGAGREDERRAGTRGDARLADRGAAPRAPLPAALPRRHAHAADR